MGYDNDNSKDEINRRLERLATILDKIQDTLEDDLNSNDAVVSGTALCALGLAAAHAITDHANSPEHAKKGVKIMIETIMTEAVTQINDKWPEFAEHLANEYNKQTRN